VPASQMKALSSNSSTAKVKIKKKKSWEDVGMYEWICDKISAIKYY
jgi:hypothetical protein